MAVHPFLVLSLKDKYLVVMLCSFLMDMKAHFHKSSVTFFLLCGVSPKQTINILLCHPTSQNGAPPVLEDGENKLNFSITSNFSVPLCSSYLVLKGTLPSLCKIFYGLHKICLLMVPSACTVLKLCILGGTAKLTDMPAV